MTLKRNYKDCEITGVTEYATSESVTYDVKLRNSKNWYSARISSEGLLLDSEKFSN